MKIAIMQPTYLPWLGYFELMHNCDRFVFLDDVQFAKKSWQHRNRIKSAQGELLLTVPVLSKGKRFQQIREVKINNGLPWRRKHLEAIRHNYAKAPFFDAYFGGLQEIYSRNYEDLLDLNITLIEFIKSKLTIATETVRSSRFDASGDKAERIIALCKSVDAQTLYDAAGAQELFDLNVFQANGITIVFQEYQHPVYRQQFAGFLSHLSALDILFNEGDRALEILLSGSPRAKPVHV